MTYLSYWKWRVINWVYWFFGAEYDPIQVSTSPHLHIQHASGYFTVNHNGMRYRIPYLVNNSFALHNPSTDTVVALFKQIEQLGFQPLEVSVRTLSGQLLLIRDNARLQQLRRLEIHGA